MELLHALPKPKNLVFVERLRFVKVMDKIDAGLRKSEIKASFQNRWFLPDWWRIAYEKAVQPNLLGMKQTSDCLLLPSLSPRNGAFCLCCRGASRSDIAQLWEGCRFTAQRVFKSVVVGGQKSENQWRRLFSTVGGLRLQASGSVISLFQKENWGDDTAGGFVRFTLSFDIRRIADRLYRPLPRDAAPRAKASIFMSIYGDSGASYPLVEVSLGRFESKRAEAVFGSC